MHWNIDPVFLDFGFIQLRYYGMFYALGIGVAFSLVTRFMKAENMSDDDATWLLVHIVVGLILGAHWAHMAFYEPENFFTWRFFQFGQGLASHGGVAGMILALWIYVRRRNVPYFQIGDMLAVAGAFPAACVRFGNFFNSEIVGHPTDLPWGIVFERIDDQARHPSQLYEGFFLLLFFPVMLVLYKTQKDRRHHGWFAALFFVVYFSFRFFIERFKSIQSSMVNDLSLLTMGQWLSIPIVLFFGVLLYITWTAKTDEQAQAPAPIKKKGKRQSR